MKQASTGGLGLFAYLPYDAGRCAGSITRWQVKRFVPGRSFWQPHVGHFVAKPQKETWRHELDFESFGDFAAKLRISRAGPGEVGRLIAVASMSSEATQ